MLLIFKFKLFAMIHSAVLLTKEKNINRAAITKMVEFIKKKLLVNIAELPERLRAEFAKHDGDTNQGKIGALSLKRKGDAFSDADSQVSTAASSNCSNLKRLRTL